MPKRLSAVVCAVLLCLLAGCTLYSKPKSGFAGATGGEQLERHFWDAIQKKDWKELQPRLAPMFVTSSPTGARDRQASIDYWQQWNLQSVSLADVQVRSAGADFIVTATLTVTGTLNGKPAPVEPVQSMTVWQQVSKGFVAVAHSDTLP
ncbi:MAG TPA: nuclear transport factor 2 family protein [Terriglobales bacterium]|nr:nuclear transport factor 2 family protein [Terriglobales bacterium]